jgi:hypothetical protein
MHALELGIQTYHLSSALLLWLIPSGMIFDCVFLFQVGDVEVKKPYFFVEASTGQDFQCPLSHSIGKDDI